MAALKTLLALSIAACAAEDLPGVVLTRGAGRASDATPTFQDLWEDAGNDVPFVVEVRRELSAAALGSTPFVRASRRPARG